MPKSGPVVHVLVRVHPFAYEDVVVTEGSNEPEWIIGDRADNVVQLCVRELKTVDEVELILQEVGKLLHVKS